MGFRCGDLVVTKPGLYWQGEDVGDRLGTVVDTTGHVLVEIHNCYNNPVKCFSWEIESVDEQIPEISDEDLTEFFGELDSKLP